MPADRSSQAAAPEWAVALAVEIHQREFGWAAQRIAAAFDAQAGKLREEQRCIAHAAYNAEGDCAFCDKEQADEEAGKLREEIQRLEARLGETEEAAAEWQERAAKAEADRASEHERCNAITVDYRKMTKAIDNALGVTAEQRQEQTGDAGLRSAVKLLLERAALWETTAAAHATVIESTLKILGESGTDVEAAAERMRDRAVTLERERDEQAFNYRATLESLRRTERERDGYKNDAERMTEVLDRRAETVAMCEALRAQVARLEEALRDIRGFVPGSAANPPNPAPGYRLIYDRADTALEGRARTPAPRQSAHPTRQSQRVNGDSESSEEG